MDEADNALRSEYERLPLREFPPSAKLVYKVLEYNDGELLQDEIAAKARMSERTMRGALSRLEAHGHIVSRPHIGDARKRVCSIAPDP